MFMFAGRGKLQPLHTCLYIAQQWRRSGGGGVWGGGGGGGGGEHTAYQEHVHWKHVQGNTFLVWTASPCITIWKRTRASDSTLGQSDFCPFANQGLSRL